MKISEIITRSQNGENLDDLISISPYIPLGIKGAMTNIISSFSISYSDSGIASYDLIMLELMTVLQIIIETTDIEIEGLVREDGSLDMKVALDSYDAIMVNDIYRFVDEQLINNDIGEMVSAEIGQRIENVNSVGAVLNRALLKIVEMIPSEEKIQGLMSSLPGLLDQIKGNPDLMNIVGTVEGTGKGRKNKKKTGDA